VTLLHRPKVECDEQHRRDAAHAGLTIGRAEGGLPGLRAADIMAELWEIELTCRE
jgi:hypothetical protein